MKIAPLLGWFGVLLTATVARADAVSAAPTRADLVRIENELSDHLTEANATFARHDAAAESVAALYVKLDDKTTALRKLSAACAEGCSALQGHALASALKDVEQTQTALRAQVLQQRTQMQEETRVYAKVSTVIKTKHDTVKSSISNIR